VTRRKTVEATPPSCCTGRARQLTGAVHRLDNGLLLRSDIHTLFDRGYLGVDPQHRLLVSPRLRADFSNGDQVYAKAGQVIDLPERRATDPGDSPGMAPRRGLPQGSRNLIEQWFTARLRAAGIRSEQVVELVEQRTLLNVSGHARTASAGGTDAPVPGIRYPDRTGSPVIRSSSTASTNLVPAGVEKTTTRHPAAWHAVTSPGTPSGAGAPLTTRYRTWLRGRPPSSTGLDLQDVSEVPG
jgi:HNH endonuclease